MNLGGLGSHVVVRYKCDNKIEENEVCGAVSIYHSTCIPKDTLKFVLTSSLYELKLRCCVQRGTRTVGVIA
jgi:hypothetical protein